MVTYLVYAPISFFFDSVATISLKSLSTLLRRENNSNLGLYALVLSRGLFFCDAPHPFRPFRYKLFSFFIFVFSFFVFLRYDIAKRSKYTPFGGDDDGACGIVDGRCCGTNKV